jgi:DNA-binding CsgD family transcriptional regulator
LFWTYLAGCFDYARQYMSGDFSAAEQTASSLLELGESVGNADGAEGPYGIQVYMVRRETGGLDQVRSLINGAERPGQHWTPGLLALYTELGLVDPARRVLKRLLDEELPRAATSAEWPAVLAFIVEAGLWLGDKAALRRLRPMLAEYAGCNLVAGPFVAVFGSADRYLGAVDSLLGDGTPEEWFASALDMDTQMRAPVHQAQTLAAHLVHLRRVGAPARRTEKLALEVRYLAEPLGLQRVLRMVGLAGWAGPGTTRPDGLTAREIEVLRLLAAGMSNRDIADRLVISENTAANHVRSILMKTGCENRTQAAMYASTRQLLS